MSFNGFSVVLLLQTILSFRNVWNPFIISPSLCVQVIIISRATKKKFSSFWGFYISLDLAWLHAKYYARGMDGLLRSLGADFALMAPWNDNARTLICAKIGPRGVTCNGNCGNLIRRRTATSHCWLMGYNNRVRPRRPKAAAEGLICIYGCLPFRFCESSSRRIPRIFKLWIWEIEVD